MKFFIGFYLLLFISKNPLFAQDERYFRKLLSGDVKVEAQKKERPVLFSFPQATYQIDINGDGLEDSFQVLVEDGLSTFVIRDHHQNEIKRFRLWAMGAESHLYKIKIVDVNPQARIMILFLDEGRTESVKFEATARLYFISIDEKDFSTLSMMAGPRYWHEKEAQREQYWNRTSVVEVLDLNKNGTKDIFVKYRSVQWIYEYRSKGEWRVL